MNSEMESKSPQGEWHTQSVAQLRKGLDGGQYTAVDLANYFLQRIERHNPELNAFISVLRDQAMSQAAIVDAKIKKHQINSPLAGIPYVVKDIFCTKDNLTTCGSKMLSNFVAPYDAFVQEKLLNAGAILLGKTNMDEFAMGSSTENSYCGVTHNPWDLHKVPGGSSGGSAVAVSARLSPVALGTDTGGSIRQPASFCGVTGLKPTYGRVSRYGIVAYASSLDQCGLFGVSAEDVALFLTTIAGHDSRDATSAQRNVPDYQRSLDEAVKGLKIGVPREYFSEGLDKNVADVIESALEVFVSLGATLTEVSLPNTALAVPAYYVVALAESSSNLARYDGIRFGYRCSEPKNIKDLINRSRSEGFSDEVKRRIMLGTFTLSSGYYDAYYIKAQKIRRLIQNDFIDAFKDVDVIMGPVSPTTAFNIGEKRHDPVTMYMADVYTVPVNLAGLPGISIPVGFVDKMPVGLQAIGNFFNEQLLLNIAHQYQAVTDWHKALPNGASDV